MHYPLSSELAAYRMSLRPEYGLDCKVCKVESSQDSCANISKYFLKNPSLLDRGCETAICLTASAAAHAESLQGYLAHKKLDAPGTLQ